MCRCKGQKEQGRVTVTQVVQEGAALAPAWTEAMFHELLDQETSPASCAALRHAADIMSIYDSAKTRHCMAGMQHSISGRRQAPVPLLAMTNFLYEHYCYLSIVNVTFQL